MILKSTLSEPWILYESCRIQFLSNNKREISTHLLKVAHLKGTKISCNGIKTGGTSYYHTINRTSFIHLLCSRQNVLGIVLWDMFTLKMEWVWEQNYTYEEVNLPLKRNCYFIQKCFKWMCHSIEFIMWKVFITCLPFEKFQGWLKWTCPTDLLFIFQQCSVLVLSIMTE